MASILGENDVEIEPMLQPLTGEQMRLRTVITGDEARLYVKATGFWRRNQVAFFDKNVNHITLGAESFMIFAFFGIFRESFCQGII